MDDVRGVDDGIPILPIQYTIYNIYLCTRFAVRFCYNTPDTAFDYIYVRGKNFSIDSARDRAAAPANVPRNSHFFPCIGITMPVS